MIHYESFKLYYEYLQDDQSRLLRFNIAIFIMLILAGHYWYLYCKKMIAKADTVYAQGIQQIGRVFIQEIVNIKAEVIIIRAEVTILEGLVQQAKKPVVPITPRRAVKTHSAQRS
ncbi:unnamed protein product [Peniophora sp. CBMAI 1063]|nr:unnamed protein product [Peniophora sp. CBMAI 1063]